MACEINRSLALLVLILECVGVCLVHNVLHHVECPSPCSLVKWCVLDIVLGVDVSLVLFDQKSDLLMAMIGSLLDGSLA